MIEEDNDLVEPTEMVASFTSPDIRLSYGSDVLRKSKEVVDKVLTSLTSF